MDNETQAVLGGTVIYTDPKGIDHDALVTALWGPRCVNVLYVSADETKRDSYGRQIERETSVTYMNSEGTAFGRVYRLVGQLRPEYHPPQAV